MISKVFTSVCLALLVALLSILRLPELALSFTYSSVSSVVRPNSSLVEPYSLKPTQIAAATTTSFLTPDINYGAGFSTGSLTLNGGATLNNTRLQLTDGATWETKSAFYSMQLDVQAFTSDFSFQLTNPTADGFAFVIQNNAPTTIGSGTGGLGYGGIAQSVALKFDLYNNSGEGNSSTGFYTNGAYPTIPATDLSRAGIDLHSGHIFNVHIKYDGAKLTWTITDSTNSKSFTTSANINIPSTLGSPLAYVGFTGSSGGAAATQEILSWTFVGFHLRGAMLSSQVQATDLNVLGNQWHANIARYPLLWDAVWNSPADTANVAAYQSWVETALANFDTLLPAFKQAGLQVVLDLHTPPGGRDPVSQYYRLFEDPQFQSAFLQLWTEIAKRYQNNTTIWGYDILNEPAEGYVNTGSGLLDWHALALKAAQNIRSIDGQHVLIVESSWGDPGQLGSFSPLPVTGVVYSVHMYTPMHLTHQGIYGNPTGVSYPGQIDGQYWDLNQLRQVLQPVIDYQRHNKVPIFIGEFSAVRWAPGSSSYNYLHDVIDIFESNGWNWTYHAFREWNGWSVEYGSDPNAQQPSPTLSDRELLLQSWFAKNQKQ